MFFEQFFVKFANHKCNIFLFSSSQTGIDNPNYEAAKGLNDQATKGLNDQAAKGLNDQAAKESNNQATKGFNDQAAKGSNDQAAKGSNDQAATESCSNKSDTKYEKKLLRESFWRKRWTRSSNKLDNKIELTAYR
jgi:hypothetical protein